MMQDRTLFALQGFLTVAATALLTLAGCSGSNTASQPLPTAKTNARFHREATDHIKHIIVIVQENRSVDNLFNRFPGADTAQSGYDSSGHSHVLQPASMTIDCDPRHTHEDFVNEFNYGSMNGWDQEKFRCEQGASLPDGAFAYVPQNETAKYWEMAANYGFADEVFQADEGPSFPSHQYLIAAQSGGHGSDAPWAMSGNPSMSGSGNGARAAAQGSYCGAAPGSTVTQIDLTSPFPGTEGNAAFPCKDYQTIFDLAMAGGFSWTYYAHSLGTVWTGPNAVKHLWANPRWRETMPETRVLADIVGHRLADIAFVTPSLANSDHPLRVINGQAGPNWVASIVNAVGNDPFYWQNTTILIVWDDWGGWFDHVAPSHPFSQDPYEYGFRVPLIVVSPYARAHVVDHTSRSSDAILAYIESTFGLGSLGMLDSRTDDLSSMFDYSQEPLQFVPVR